MIVQLLLSQLQSPPPPPQENVAKAHLVLVQSHCCRHDPELHLGHKGSLYDAQWRNVSFLFYNSGFVQLSRTLQVMAAVGER